MKKNNLFILTVSTILFSIASCKKETQSENINTKIKTTEAQEGEALLLKHGFKKGTVNTTVRKNESNKTLGHSLSLTELKEMPSLAWDPVLSGGEIEDMAQGTEPITLTIYTNTYHFSGFHAAGLPSIFTYWKNSSGTAPYQTFSINTSILADDGLIGLPGGRSTFTYSHGIAEATATTAVIEGYLQELVEFADVPYIRNYRVNFHDGIQWGYIKLTLL